MLGAALQTAVRVLYPPRCLSCGGMVEQDFGLCGTCWRDTPFITGLVCDSCGTPLPGDSNTIELRDACLQTARPWDRGRAAMLYKDNGRKLVLALKHGDRHDIADPAALWLARTLRPILPDTPLIVPVPLHLTRLLRRRFNQSALLAQALARVLNADCCPDALLRPTRTPSLDGHSRDERFATMAGTLIANPKRRAQMAGRDVVIVDDVMTSGATMAAATDACHEADANTVCIAALARVAKDA